MVDYTSLSKEDLIKLLVDKDTLEHEPEIQSEINDKSEEESVDLASNITNLSEEVPQLDIPQCRYRASRGNQTPCPELATTPYEYCNRHKGTVQAKNAKIKWEKKEIFDSANETEKVEEEVEDDKPYTPEIDSLFEEKVENNKLLEGLYDGKSSENNNNSGYKQLGNIKKEISQRNGPAIRKKKIVRNMFDRFEDTKTGIVFDPITKKAFGVQKKDGSITKLTRQKIEICKKKGWKYASVDKKSETDEENESDSSISDDSDSLSASLSDSSNSESTENSSDESESESESDSSIIEEVYNPSDSD